MSRRRAYVVLGTAVAIVVAAAVVVALSVTGSAGPSKAAPRPAITTPATGILPLLRTVPAATLDRIGQGLSAPPRKVTGRPPLRAGRKPQVLFIGAEFCPFCAAERWAVAVALARFGRLSGVALIRSSEADIATLDFRDVRYQSPYLGFVARESEDQDHRPLQSLSAAQRATLQALTHSATINFPTVDIGNRFALIGSSIQPEVLLGMNHRQIASALADPTSPVAQAVDGGANVLTAAICDVTGGRPAAVCGSAAMTHLRTVVAGA